MNIRGWLKGTISIGACALAIGSWTAIARAEDFGNHLYDRFQVTGAGSMLWLGSDARVDAKDGSIGTDLDVEEDLGLTKTKYQPRFGFSWKPGRKHQLEASYQFARRSAQKALERDIAVGDTTFNAGADVKSTFDTDNALLTYRYAFIANDRTQVGLGLGLGAFFFKVGVDATGTISGGGGSASGAYSSTVSFVGPTGALGAYARFRSGDRWYLEPDLRYLRVEIDRFTAKVLEGGFLAHYYVSPRVGLEGGVGVRAIQVDMGPKADGGYGPDLSARIKYAERQFRLGVVLPL